MVIPGPTDVLDFIHRVLGFVSEGAYTIASFWSSFTTEVISPEVTDEQDIYGRHLFYRSTSPSRSLSTSMEVFHFFEDIVRFLCQEPLKFAQEDEEYEDRFKGLTNISNESLIDHTLTEFGVRGMIPPFLDESAFSEAGSENFVQFTPPSPDPVLPQD